jgi:hypothetical protein
VKKIIVALMVITFSAALFAVDVDEEKDQKFTISGFAKSGLMWEKEEKVAKDPKESVRLGSRNDDAGDQAGRFRLDMEYANGNMGAKVRFQWDNWREVGMAPTWWQYAFGYGNFFDDQLTLAIGKLGASPWGTGGPEMWKELEVSNAGGVRFEIKPNIVPGELNVGFVLNWVNGSQDQGLSTIDVTLWELLRESVLGISYTHDYFLVRFAYRLDSELDTRPGSGLTGGVKEGDDLIYRYEERILKNYLPGMQIWGLGSFEGVGAAEEAKSVIRFVNWLFTQYEPEDMFGLNTPFTAQIRFGYDVVSNRSILHFKPSFYWNFFDKFVSVGAAFLYGQDFGEGKLYPGAPYTYMEIEPKLQVNFSPNAYAAFVYNFRREYINKESEQPGQSPIEQFQWMNLRFGVTF